MAGREFFTFSYAYKYCGYAALLYAQAATNAFQIVGSKRSRHFD
jgi:hypothetical protein